MHLIAARQARDGLEQALEGVCRDSRIGADAELTQWPMPQW